MFDNLIVQPIFNLLVLIAAVIPGHNFGLAIILFTILIRLLMWPLVKKQLHHAKAIRQLQPEIKKIKQAAKGDRQKQSQLTMELYKERQINPFASIGVILVQIPILLGLFFAVRKIVDKPQEIINFSYSFIRDLGWIQSLSQDIHRFDETLFGVMDLTRSAVGDGGIYLPALMLVTGSAVAQYFQSKQLMPQSDDARSLRKILKEASGGKTADQQEVNAAVGRMTLYLIPGFVFLFSLSFPAALPLYWFVSSSVAFLQQRSVLKSDVTEAEALVENTSTETAVERKAKAKKRSEERKKAKARGRRRK
jgi:YidC/Oxa1 family membrane protein insertase